MVGGYAANSWVGAVAALGTILGAAYMLYLYWRIAFGAARTAEAAAMLDLSGRELFILAPIAAAVFWMGVYPESFLSPMRADVDLLLTRIERAAPPGDAQPTAGTSILRTVWVVGPVHDADGRVIDGHASTPQSNGEAEAHH
jgi:NADH-quinone oxidoreductase subunit M